MYVAHLYSYSCEGRIFVPVFLFLFTALDYGGYNVHRKEESILYRNNFFFWIKYKATILPLFYE